MEREYKIPMITFLNSVIAYFVRCYFYMKILSYQRKSKNKI